MLTNMKRVILLVFTLYGFIINSQSITSAEYFFNTDPGIGNGTTLTVDSNTGILTQTFTIPTGSLNDGFNSIYIRTYNSDNNWSLYDKQNFYIKNFNSHHIKSAEYFFNTDPGVGNGTNLVVDNNSGQLSQIFSIQTNNLLEGFHSFYIRSQDNANNWSLYDRQIIYIKDFDLSPDEVSSAEYFIDSDPGVGNGTSIVFENASASSQILNIASNNLAEGAHLFYVRVQDTNGDWSIYDTALFTIDSSLNVNNYLLSNISLLPNPFKNNLYLKLPNTIQIIKTEIYNNIGQTVYSSLENKLALNLPNLDRGLYILNLKTNSGSISFKIIKK